MTAKNVKRWVAFTCLLGAAVAVNNCITQNFGGVEADTGGLSGTLLDAQGIPVAYALVRVYPDTDTTNPLAKITINNEIAADSTRTDANGRFRFPKLKSGHCNLECTYKRNNDTQTVFMPGIKLDSSFDCGNKTLYKPGAILLKAQSEEGPFLSGVRCDIPGSPFSTVSDSSGKCLIRNVPPGLFRVRLQKDGFIPKIIDSLEVQSDKTTDGGIVTLTAISSTLVAHWDFDESSGSILHDRTGNGHDGTISGTPAWTSDGVAGGSLHFDGSTLHVEVPTSSAFTGLREFTLSAWVWQNVQDMDRPVMEFSQSGSLSGTMVWVNTSGYGIVLPGSVNNCFRSVVSQSDRSGYQFYAPAGIVSTSHWNHIVLTYDSLSHTARSYVNGILQNSLTIPLTYSPSTAGPFYLGWRPTTSIESRAGVHFFGRMDEVRIYSTALNATQIESLYSNRPTP